MSERERDECDDVDPMIAGINRMIGGRPPAGDTPSEGGDRDLPDATIARGLQVGKGPSRRKPKRVVKCPFKVIVDSREQVPYTFVGLLADANRGGGTLEVETERGALPVGDYMAFGYPGCVVERKSKSDLYGSISGRRSNFVERLERMTDELDFGAVVVEAQWDELINSPPRHTAYSSKCLFRTILAWMQRYPTVHWLMCPGRRAAEVMTFRVLERYYRDHAARA